MKHILAETKAYVVTLLVVLVALVWMLVIGSMPVSDDKTPVRVVIAKGASAAEIASILGEKNLIRSPFVFRLTCRVGGSSVRLKPGVYEFSKSMSLPTIIAKLVQGETLEQWVTVPEGYTIRQIADLLEAKQLADADAFVRLAITRGYEFSKYAFVYGNNLEGYLFPDTYLIARGTDMHGIIEKMLDAFEVKVALPLGTEIESVASKRFGLGSKAFTEGMNKILILASLVEREAKTPKDRPLVAAVLWNRLAKNMRLEVDATVSYIPGESKHNKNKLYYSDLEIDSPYNTYKYAGLPPAPICNPGLASIKAVLYPADVDYLYYVARPDGSHVFSRTFEEHVRAKRAIKALTKTK